MSEIRDGYIIDCVSGQELKATPEEVQAVQPFAMKLMADYDYPKSHIQTRPQWHVKVRPSDVKKNILLTSLYLLMQAIMTIIFS